MKTWTIDKVNDDYQQRDKFSTKLYLRPVHVSIIMHLAGYVWCIVYIVCHRLAAEQYFLWQLVCWCCCLLGVVWVVTLDCCVFSQDMRDQHDQGRPCLQTLCCRGSWRALDIGKWCGSVCLSARVCASVCICVHLCVCVRLCSWRLNFLFQLYIYN